MQNITTESLNTFTVLIQELTDVVKEISQIENEKAQAVSLYHHTDLEACIRKEQASILKLKGLEAKRLEYMREHGWEGLSFRQVLPLLPESQSGILSPFFDDLSRAVEGLSSSRQSAERILNLRMRSFQTFLEQEHRNSTMKNNSNSHNLSMREKYV